MLSSTVVSERLPSYRSRVSNGSDLHARGVDGRSAPARRFRDLMLSLAQPFGGIEQLSESERSLVRSAALLTVEAERLQARAASGKPVDLEALVRVSNSQARLLGVIRRGRETSRAAQSHVTFAERLAAKYGGQP